MSLHMCLQGSFIIRLVVTEMAGDWAHGVLVPQMIVILSLDLKMLLTVITGNVFMAVFNMT